VRPGSGQHGFTVLLTGLPGAGKSSIASGLTTVLRERTALDVTLLDGDQVRRHLSSDLGFSKADRDANVRRIGSVASEITAKGGVAICALIAPYASARREARSMVERVGVFVEVHVATPLAVCEARDPKGLYKRARAGEIEGFTGIDDPYEEPETPEIRIDTTELDADRAIDRVLAGLERLDLLG
jgi:sulfate adenylyltransferase